MDSEQESCVEMVTREDLERAAHELYYWQHVGAMNFTSRLFNLIHKADPENRKRLTKCFPVEVAIWESWYSSSHPEEFYKLWKVGPYTEEE